MSDRPTRPNWVVLGVGLALIAPMLWLFWASFGNDPRAVPFALREQPAPAFSAVDLDGRTWSSDELKGRPVVLNFWSTWCQPCKLEHPVLLRTAQMYPEVVFLGAIYDDEPDKIRRYLAREGTAYPHLVDGAGRLAIDYGVAGVPETFFIDAEGVLRYKHAGALDPRSMQRALDLIR